jgi:hypothetical protein
MKKTIKNPVTWQTVLLVATVYFVIIKGLLG